MEIALFALADSYCRSRSTLGRVLISTVRDNTHCRYVYDNVSSFLREDSYHQVYGSLVYWDYRSFAKSKTPLFSHSVYLSSCFLFIHRIFIETIYTSVFHVQS